MDVCETHRLPDAIVRMLKQHGITHDFQIFAENNEWFYRKTSSLPGKNSYSSNNPIGTLGPFGTASVNLKLNLDTKSSRYEIIEIEGKEVTSEKPLVGVHTPFAEITLEGFARTTANIPESATHFCWLYPVGIYPEEKESIRNENIIQHNLLKIGGFAYFKVAQTIEMICVNALIVTDQNGLNFDGPHKWDSDFTPKLWQENRFRPVTLSSLIEKNVRYFAFISPREILRNSSDTRYWTPSEHGAFVYLFNEDGSHHPHDCYFDVADECLGFTVTDNA